MTHNRIEIDPAIIKLNAIRRSLRERWEERG